MDLVKPQSREEYMQDFIKQHGGWEKAFPAIMLEGMFGRYGKMPLSGDQNEIASKAVRDIKNMDFSDIADYVDTLVQIADHYQELAEQYGRELAYCGYTFDSYGSPQDPENEEAATHLSEAHKLTSKG